VLATAVRPNLTPLGAQGWNPIALHEVTEKRQVARTKAVLPVEIVEGDPKLAGVFHGQILTEG
jgi:hypothetical protein